MVIENYALLSPSDRNRLAALVENWIPIMATAQDTGLHPEILKMLVKYEVISGDEGACDQVQARQVAEQLRAAREPVEGQGIGIAEAFEKYGFSNTSIYRWASEGWVKVIGRAEKYNAKLYDEGDLAFANALAKLIGRKRGRSIFPAQPRTGRPRKHK